MFGASHFNGGRGNDFADICGNEATLVSVELTSDDCPDDLGPIDRRHIDV